MASATTKSAASAKLPLSTRPTVEVRSADPFWDAHLKDSNRILFFRLAVFLVFLRVSLLHELIAYKLGVNTYILTIFGSLTIVGILLTGGVQRTLRARAALFWCGFAVWMILAVPFSSWRGGSTTLVLSYLRTEFTMLFVIAGLAMTWRECRTFMTAIGLAAVMNVLSGRIFLSGGEDYRRAVSFGTLSGPNDYAAHLLLALPFVALYILRAKRSIFIRLGAVIIVLFGLFLIVQTASRGAFIALAVVFLIYLKMASVHQKVAGLLVIPLMVAVAFFYSDSRSIRRLQSLYSPYSASGELVLDEATEASTAQRSYLLRKSIEYSLRYPIFGVGPGQFGTFEGTASRDSGRHGAWMQTHNAYTQVSSECGIPALMFFLLAIGSAVGLLRRLYRRAQEQKNSDIAVSALCVIIAFGGFCASLLFLSQTYYFYLPLLTSLAIAMSVAGHRELSALAAEKPSNPRAGGPGLPGGRGLARS